MNAHKAFRAIWILVFAVSLFRSSFVFALPQGEAVVSGTATFDTSTPDTLTITTPSDKLIVNYDRFNIGVSETVQFVQPSASSVALNRVVGSDPTAVLGSLIANGKIFLINPNGVLFGAGSRVDAAGLVASTLNISDKDFLNGDYIFFKDGESAFLKNDGEITVRNGGYVCLLAQAVDNGGEIGIEAGVGSIALAAGDKMTLNLDDAGDISVVIDEAVQDAVFSNGQKVEDAIANSGRISAQGGTILLTAKVLNDVFDHAINNSGIVEATSIVDHNGVIELVADGGSIVQKGLISANGKDGEDAGRVTISSTDTVTLESGSKTSAAATGLTGNGGSVSISGKNIFAEPDAKIDVSGGTNQGNAGVVLLNASEKLGFYGLLDGRAAPGNIAGLFLFANNPVLTQPTVTTDKLDYDSDEKPIITGTGFDPYTPVTVNITNPGGEQDTVTVTTDAEGDFMFIYDPGNLSHGAYNATATDGTRSAVTAFSDSSEVFVLIGTVDPDPVPGGYNVSLTIPLTIPLNKTNPDGTPNNSRNYQSVAAFEFDLFAPIIGTVDGWGELSFESFVGPNLAEWYQLSGTAGTLSDPATMVIATTSDTYALANGTTGYLTFSVETPTLTGVGPWASEWTIKGWTNKNQAGSKTADFYTTIEMGIVEALLSVEDAPDGTGSVLGPVSIDAGDSVIAYAITRDTYGNFISAVNADWSAVNESDPGIGDVNPVTGTLSTVFTGLLAGTANIQADSGGNSALSNFITVAALPLTITANDNAKIYGTILTFGGTEYFISSGSLLPGDAVTSVTLTSTGAAEGASVSTYSIVPSDAAGTGLNKYDITYANGTLTVTPKSASVTPNAASKTYGAVDPALTGNLIGFLTADSVTATYGRAAGETVAGGPYIISATLDPTGVLGNYNITYNTADFTITQKSASVTPNAASKTYGAVDPALTGNLIGFLTADSVTATYGRAAGETVAGGPYIISATLDPTGVLGNYNITYNTADFTITQKSASVTPNAATKTYGAVDPALTGNLIGFLTADSVTATYGRAAGETVAGGPYTISATLDPAGVLGNYNITYNTADFTITQKSASVTPDAASKVYGDVDPTLTGNLLGFLTADNVTADYTRASGETVGASPYTISATLDPAGVLGNYNITYNTADFTITQKSASVTPNAATKTYGAVDPALTGNLIGFLTADSVTATYGRAAGETVAGGPYTISATLDPAGVLGNYNITYNTADFTITQKSASVTPDAASKVYGDVDPALTGNLIGFLTADSVTATYGRAAGETVAGGPYTISATLDPTGVLGNYDITYNTADFTITQKSASVTPDAASKVYGAVDPTLTGILDGFLVADSVTATYGRAAGETVAGGPYTISATLDPAGVLGNYNITYNTADFTITQRSASVTPNAATKTYGDVDPTLTGNLLGFLTADNVTADYTRASGETVGASPYTISATLDPTGVLGNYNITYNTADFTITQKSASVTPNAATKTYGDVDPTLTGNLLGFLTADAVTANYTRASGETVAGGPYTISATLDPDAVLDNYNITYNTANFTITPKGLAITADDAIKPYGNTLTFAGTEFTAVGLIGNDTVNSVTLFSSGVTAGANAGTYEIVPSNATGFGLSNYAITYTNGTLTITSAPPPVVLDAAKYEQLRYKLPYLEQLVPHQINPLDLVSSTDLIGPAYFYHPIVETNMSAYDEFVLEEGAYEFIEQNINIIGHEGLLPILEETRKRHIPVL